MLFEASLRSCFIDGLINSDANVLYNCLRAYAATDNVKNAEEVFRTTIVAPFVHNVIAHEAYDGTLRDELENDYKQIKHFVANDCKTLLEISSTGNPLKFSASSYLFYSPWQRNASEFEWITIGHLFSSECCCFYILLTLLFSWYLVFKSDKSGLHVFNFLANSILKEVILAIQKVKPGVFSPGRPTEFLKNYKASLDFLAYLEGRVTDLHFSL